jgi:hypothetical protein
MSPTRLSRIENATRTALDFNAAFNRHDLPGMLALVSENCILECATPAPNGERLQGKAELTRYWSRLLQDSPQIQIQLQIEEIFGLGMRCILRGRFSGLDETGRLIQVRGVDIYQLREGLICEILSYRKG